MGGGGARHGQPRPTAPSPRPGPRRSGKRDRSVLTSTPQPGTHVRPPGRATTDAGDVDPAGDHAGSRSGTLLPSSGGPVLPRRGGPLGPAATAVTGDIQDQVQGGGKGQPDRGPGPGPGSGPCPRGQPARAD